MATFTTITHGFTPQLSMSEIVDAVNERRAAAIASGATGLPSAIPSTPASVQSLQGGSVKPIHLLIQELLEALSTRYINHNASTPVTTFYTLATWRAEASLNSSGFKRATEWLDPSVNPTFSYGLIQTGDIAGYWIWQEIVNGIKALKWTRKIPNAYSGEHIDLSANASTVSGAKSAVDALWSSGTWITTGAWDYRACYVSISEEQSDNTYFAYVSGERSTMKVTLSSSAPVSCTVKFIMSVDDGGYATYYDFESLAENTLIEIDEQTIAATGTVAIMDSTNMPSPTATPAGSSGLTPGNSAGSASNANYGLIQWNFSRV